MNQVENYLLAVMDGKAGAIQRAYSGCIYVERVAIGDFFLDQYVPLYHPGPLVEEMALWIAVRFPWVGENEKPEKW